MGRYSSDPALAAIKTDSNSPDKWPTEFPEVMVSLDMHGILIEYVKDINHTSQVQAIPGALDCVRQLRLKGHKVYILADYPGISYGKQSSQSADAINKHLMYLLGQAGCYSVDGMLWNVSDKKQDPYAKPNIGMINRAKTEMNMDFSGGYHVGDSLEDLVMAVKAKLTPVLILSGKGNETLKSLGKYANKDLKSKVKVFPDLQSFVSSL